MGLNYIDYWDLKPKYKSRIKGKREIFQKVTLEHHALMVCSGSVGTQPEQDCRGKASASHVRREALGGTGKRQSLQDPFSFAPSEVTLRVTNSSLKISKASTEKNYCHKYTRINRFCFFTAASSPSSPTRGCYVFLQHDWQIRIYCTYVCAPLNKKYTYIFR